MWSVPIALSSAEAEFYGSAKAAVRLLGVAALWEDFGVAGLRRHLLSDSSAARGILARRGTGRIRHLETQTLWVQKAVQDGRFSVGSVPGKTNPADLGTKFLDVSSTARHLKFLGLGFARGRDSEALRAKH